MKGLIEEGNEWIGEDAEAEVMDAGVIAEQIEAEQKRRAAEAKGREC